MRRIYKYPLTGAETVLRLRQEPEVVRVAVEPGRHLPTVWVMVRNPDSDPYQAWTFYVVGTGHDIPENAAVHEGSCATPYGAFVWHVFSGTNFEDVS